MKKLVLVLLIIILIACSKQPKKISSEGEWIVSKIELTDQCDPMAGLIGWAFTHDSTFTFRHDFLYFNDEILGFRYADTLYYADGEKAIMRFKADSLILNGDIIYTLYKKE